MDISLASTVGTFFNSGTSSNSIIIPVGAGGAAAGNNVIIGAGGKSTALTVTSVTDSRSNTWQVDSTNGSSTTRTVFVISSLITTALQSGDNITINISGATTDRWGGAYEYRGLSRNVWVDQVNSNSSTSTAPNSGNLVTTFQRDLIFGAESHNLAGGTYAVGSTGGNTFNLLNTFGAGGNQMATEYLVVYSTGTYTTNGTIGNANWTQIGVAYRGAISSLASVGVG